MKSKFALLAILASGSSYVYAAQATAPVTASQTVTPPAVTLRVDHALTFVDAAQGAPAVTVAPADANAANIAIVNGAGRSATISVVESSINLDDGAGNTVAVNAFAGSPALGGITLPNTGEQVVKVGATREALTGKPAGSYTGVFTFKVVY